MNSLRAEHQLGIELTKFIETDVGKYLDGCSQQDVEAAKDELLEIDPYKFTTLRALQNKICDIQHKAKVAMSLRQYLYDAIINAQQAEHQLNHEGQD